MIFSELIFQKSSTDQLGDWGFIDYLYIELEQHPPKALEI